MRKILIVLFSFFINSHVYAEVNDSLTMGKSRSSFFNIVNPIIKIFSETDTAYISPNKYNFQSMLQNRYSYEVYRLTDNNGNSIRFEPKPSLKIGPYAGFSLIFLGVTIDVLHLNNGNRRKEWDLSIYTLPLGIDIYYRQSGNNYILKNITLNEVKDTRQIENIGFKGFKSSVSGFDIYYIFNHKKFSYPAAFNQSTQQRRSFGSPLAGIGFTRHSISIDWQMLNSLFIDNLEYNLFENFTDKPITETITYTDFSLSGGYGYNWVFAKNWLFASSLSIAVSRKQSIADSEKGFKALETTLKNLQYFKFSDITIDAVGRFGIVWNNGKWFAGASAIIHSYNYSKSNFYTNNIFGSFNTYFGINIGLKKKYKIKNTRDL